MRLTTYAFYVLSVTLLSVIILRGSAHTGVEQDMTLIGVVFLTFTVAAYVRNRLVRVFVLHEQPLVQPKRQFYVELGIYLLSAVSLASTAWLMGNELQLILSLLIWPLVVGYFASTECALERERDCYETSLYGHKLEVEHNSFAGRLNMFISATVLMVILVSAQTAYGYMGLKINDAVKQEFVIDMLFIIGLTVSLSVRIIYSYSLNLQQLFAAQVKGLKNIQQGKLDRYVPVQSSDEFGVIAEQTNVMIDELRDKEKVQKTLEQIVGSDIMKKLLSGDKNELKNGQNYDIAILFCDMRRFTSFTENTPSEDVIFFLNAYFAKIADIVAEHNGIVNKFMGDAILAVFGVEGNENYIDDAVDTAWDILDHSSHVCMKDGTTIDVGIGVHRGRATACTIGSSERYEYTFIGDTVNTASRLDGLSKELGYRILISDKVYRDIDGKTKSRFVDLGNQQIRGKAQPLRVYGAEPMFGMDAENDKIISISSRRGGHE